MARMLERRGHELGEEKKNRGRKNKKEGPTEREEAMAMTAI